MRIIRFKPNRYMINIEDKNEERRKIREGRKRASEKEIIGERDYRKKRGLFEKSAELTKARCVLLLLFEFNRVLVI